MASSTRSSQPSDVPVEDPPRSRQSWAWKWLRDRSGVETPWTAASCRRPHRGWRGASAGWSPKPRSSGSRASAGTAMPGRAAGEVGVGCRHHHGQAVQPPAQEHHDQRARRPRLAERRRGPSRGGRPGRRRHRSRPACRNARRDIPPVQASRWAAASAATVAARARTAPSPGVGPSRRSSPGTVGVGSAPVVGGRSGHCRCSSPEGEVGRVEHEGEGGARQVVPDRGGRVAPEEGHQCVAMGGLERLEAGAGTEVVDEAPRWWPRRPWPRGRDGRDRPPSRRSACDAGSSR